MKYLLIIFLACSSLLYGQNYFDQNGAPLKDANQAEYYELPVVIDSHSGRFVQRSFYMDGKLRQETFYLDKGKQKKEGLQRCWYSDGPLKWSLNYVGNQLQDSILSYWHNGMPKRKDWFEKDKFVRGVCYDSIGHPVEHTALWVLPVFPGGEKGLVEYIRNNLRYPMDAASSGIQGKVVIQFVILKNGKPDRFEVKTSVDRSLDREAMRIVKAMPKWTPAYQDGEPTECWFTLPIIFRMM